jgi:hypothetical protein
MGFGGIVNKSRVRIVKEVREETGPVACWMSRDQRANDNWALLFAQEIALKQHMPMNYPAAELRGIWNTEHSSQ